MKVEKNILIAFIINIVFSAIELVGGVITGSVAIISDSVHDFGDALSIGVSYFLERKSKKRPDAKYSYGYARFSTLGALVTAGILIVGSAVVIANSVSRLQDPVPIDYPKMIGLAIFGLIANGVAAYVTHRGESLNQRSVNLHMLEDVLGWAVVLVGAVVMNIFGWAWLDPIMSIGVAIFLLVETCKNVVAVFDVFLEKTPRGVQLAEVRAELAKIRGVANAHHLHVWSLDGEKMYATVHLKLDGAVGTEKVKMAARKVFEQHKITHVTIETEGRGERCGDE